MHEIYKLHSVECGDIMVMCSEYLLGMGLGLRLVLTPTLYSASTRTYATLRDETANITNGRVR
jgi:hypothetical protein